MSVLRAALSEEDPDPAVHQALQRTFPLPAGRLEDPARVSEAHRVFRQSVFVYRLPQLRKALSAEPENFTAHERDRPEAEAVKTEPSQKRQ